jgi:hypothetical protein
MQIKNRNCPKNNNTQFITRKSKTQHSNMASESKTQGKILMVLSGDTRELGPKNTPTGECDERPLLLFSVLLVKKLDLVADRLSFF